MALVPLEISEPEIHTAPLSMDYSCVLNSWIWRKIMGIHTHTVDTVAQSEILGA